MNIGKVLFKVPHDLTKIFRNIERISKKFINKKWSLIFNKMCLNVHLWPKFIVKIKKYYF